jgi:hypothetical protein
MGVVRVWYDKTQFSISDVLKFMVLADGYGHYQHDFYVLIALIIYDVT